jgi:MFS family permease
MEGIIIISVIAGFITGLIGMYVAKEKNRSDSEGFLFGFLLSLIGIIIVALLPTKEAVAEIKKVELTKEQLEENSDDMSNTDNILKYFLIFALLLVPIVIILMFLS